jgi:hypothetical protein
MKGEGFEEYVNEYGAPLLRVDVFSKSEEERVRGDVPDEVAVFQIPHPSNVMVVARYGERCVANSGERFVVDHLLLLVRDLHRRLERVGALRSRAGAADVVAEAEEESRFLERAGHDRVLAILLVVMFGALLTGLIFIAL